MKPLSCCAMFASTGEHTKGCRTPIYASLAAQREARRSAPRCECDWDPGSSHPEDAHPPTLISMCEPCVITMLSERVERLEADRDALLASDNTKDEVHAAVLVLLEESMVVLACCEAPRDPEWRERYDVLITLLSRVLRGPDV